MVDVGPLTPADVPLEGVEEYVAHLHAAVGEMRTPIGSVLLDIATERIEQDGKYGQQNRRNGTGGTRYRDSAEKAHADFTTITEMGMEPSWAILMKHLTASAYTQTNPADLRARVIKIAAAAAAWAECIDRRAGVAAYCDAADAHRMAHIPVVPPAPHDVSGSE